MLGGYVILFIISRYMCFVYFKTGECPVLGFWKTNQDQRIAGSGFFFSKTSKGLMGFHERTGKELVILWAVMWLFQKKRTIVGQFWEFKSNPQLPRLDPLLMLDPVSRTTLNVSILRSGFCFKNKKKKTCSMSDNCFQLNLRLKHMLEWFHWWGSSILQDPFHFLWHLTQNWCCIRIMLHSGF